MKHTGKRLLGFNPFAHNGFTLGFSVLAAFVIWFAMSFSQLSDEKPHQISDVPIVFKVSERAEEAGLKIFSQTQETIDVFVTGNSSVVSKLRPEDFVVEAVLDPDSTKVNGSTLQTQTLTVRINKAQTLKDFKISSHDPEQITVEYDRIKKVTLPIEDQMKWQTEPGFHVSKPSFSETDVFIEGPESVVNKIARAALMSELDGTLKEDKHFTSPLILLDADNKPLTEANRRYLTGSTDVEVKFTVLPMKNVPIEPDLLGQPEGFPNSRITISPDSIAVAATAERLAVLESIRPDQMINFADITPSNRTFNLDISSNFTGDVKNISDVVSVEVSFNLNGYREAQFNTSNITLINAPPGHNPQKVTQSVTITVMGSESQISKLTGDSIHCTANLENFTTTSGSVEVPVSVKIDGANSCWAVGSTVVTVNMDAVAADAPANEFNRANAQDVATVLANS